MKHTVIALFDSAEVAQDASKAVKARGFDESAVHVSLGSEAGDSEVIAPAVTIESGPLTGLLHRLSLLFGVEEPHLAHYEEAIRRGGHVVHVDADDEAQAATARDALLANGAVNIEDRVEEWLSAGWRSPSAKAQAAGSMSGVVHRQEVSIQGVRVYGHVVVVPFEDLADDFRWTIRRGMRLRARPTRTSIWRIATVTRWRRTPASTVGTGTRSKRRYVPNGHGVIRKAAGSGSRVPCDMPGHAPHGSERWRLAAREHLHLSRHCPSAAAQPGPQIG